jgi:DegV family protein with EDD domain
MVNILTDSCADLSKALISKFQIDQIRLSVFINNQTFSDGLDINAPELFKYVETSRLLPKTSAPSIADFMRFFDREGDSVYVGISNKLSATVPNAIMAAKNLEYRSIRIVDSLNLSTGIGLLVLLAAELRDQGCPADEIAAEIAAATSKIHTSFVIDTLDYLYMGGRCSAMTHIVGSLLKIRPVIEVHKDGTLGVRDKIRGTRKRSLDSLLEDFEAHLSVLDPHRVFITHTGCDADANYLAEKIGALVQVDDLCITTAGSTVSSHCGPDTIGILYLER